MGEFVTQYAGAVAWLSLDEEENDPVRFWTYLIKALQTVKADLGESALALFDLPQLPPADSIAAILINDLARLDIELVLVLDDLHLIQNEEIHRAISYLIDHIPGKFHLLVSTRIDPPGLSRDCEPAASWWKFGLVNCVFLMKKLQFFSSNYWDSNYLKRMWKRLRVALRGGLLPYNWPRFQCRGEQTFPDL